MSSLHLKDDFIFEFLKKFPYNWKNMRKSYKKNFYLNKF